MEDSDRSRTGVGANAAPQPSGGTSGSSGLPWGKIAMGCGCLSVVALIALGVVGYFTFMKTSDFLADKKKEFGLGDVEVTKLLEEGERKKATRKAKKSVQKKAETAKSLEPAAIRRELQKPLLPKDVDAVLGLVEKLRKDPAYKEWTASFEELKELGKSKETGTLKDIKKLRGVTKGMGAQRKVYERYQELIEEQGGMSVYLGRLVRVSGAAAAASQIAKDHKLKEPASRKVAAQVLKDRPEIKKEFLASVAEAKKMAARKDGSDDPSGYSGMLMMMQKPGTIAMARMPEKSFRTWKSLPEKKRRKIFELQSSNAKDFPALLVGVTVRGEPLIVASELEEWKNLKK